MTKPAADDKVHVIVHERPNKVWVVCNDVIHYATWRTSDNGDALRNVDGNTGLLNAAMLAWQGKERFSLTFSELEKASGGWGAWN